MCICILGQTYQNLPTYNPSLPCVNVTQCSGGAYFPATLTTDNICAVLTLTFYADFNLVNTTAGASSFEAALISAINNLNGIPQPLFLEIVLRAGSIVASLQLANQDAATIISTAASNGLLKFEWNGLSFTATTTAVTCNAGYVPDSSGTCVACSANTYVCISHFSC